MPLHDQITAASVLANNQSDDGLLNQRIGVVVQDLSNWHYYLMEQRLRLGQSSKFNAKYDAFSTIINQIDVMSSEIEKHSPIDAQSVEAYEKRAVDIYESISSVARLHRDKGVKGLLKVTFFRQPQSEQDFELFTPPTYRR